MSKFKLVPVEPDEAMMSAALAAMSAQGGNIFQALKDALAAAPQPPALGGEPESKLIKLAAELANRRPLRQLQDLCDRQKSISTAKLIEDVEMCGDTLAAIALDIRNCADASRAHLAPLQAEIERLTDSLANHDSVSKVMNAWVAEKGQMPWATAIKTLAIITKMPDQERDRLLNMDDGSTERVALTEERDRLQARCDELRRMLGIAWGKWRRKCRRVQKDRRRNCTARLAKPAGSEKA